MTFRTTIHYRTFPVASKLVLPQTWQDEEEFVNKLPNVPEMHENIGLYFEVLVSQTQLWRASQCRTNNVYRGADFPHFAQDRKVYWADLGLKNSNLLNNSVGISQIGRAITELKKPTLYELFGMQPEGVACSSLHKMKPKQHLVCMKGKWKRSTQTSF